MRRLVPYEDPYLAAEEPMVAPATFRKRPEAISVQTDMWTWGDEAYIFPGKWAWRAQPPP